MKVFAPLLIMAAFALVALAGDRPAGGEQPSVLLSDSTGALEVKNPQSGQAVVTGLNMAPGESVKGRVWVGVNRKADMHLSIADVTHGPGPSGATLGGSLKVNVRRIGRGPGPRHVYRGTLDAVGAFELGRWLPGSSHGYRVRLKLPYTRASQNALQGASSQFSLLWQAHEHE
jgi:hypothetical protein